MELTYDWRGFQSVFSPRRRTSLQEGSEPTGPIYLIVEKDCVVTPFASSEDLSDWIGAPISDMALEFNHRELVVFERADVDKWLGEGTKLPHSYAQADALGASAQPRIFVKGHLRKTKGKTPPSMSPKHFLLEAILGAGGAAEGTGGSPGWWGKVLPSAYGIFIRLEGPTGASAYSSPTGAAPTEGPRDFFIMVRRGRLEAFCEPDLSSMGIDRCRQSEDVIKYLSEKYLIPIQGVFVAASEWREWGESAHPWRKVALSIRANHAKLVPFRWSLVTMIATRGFLEI